MEHLVVYTEYPTYNPPSIQIYRGTEEKAAEQAEWYLEDLDRRSVIYFYAVIETVNLRDH